MIAEAGLDIPIFTVDTGRLHPETHDLIDRTNKRYGFRMRVYCPDAREVEEMVAADGIDLFRDSEFLRQLCCETRKTRPLRRAQVGLDAWICGLRSGRGVGGETRGAGGVGQRRRPPEAQSARRVGRGARVGLRPAPTTSPTTRCTTRASRPSTARRACARATESPPSEQQRTYLRRIDDAAGDRAGPARGARRRHPRGGPRRRRPPLLRAAWRSPRRWAPRTRSSRT